MYLAGAIITYLVMFFLQLVGVDMKFDDWAFAFAMMLGCVIAWPFVWIYILVQLGNYILQKYHD